MAKLMLTEQQEIGRFVLAVENFLRLHIADSGTPAATRLRTLLQSDYLQRLKYTYSASGFMDQIDVQETEFAKQPENETPNREYGSANTEPPCDGLRNRDADIAGGKR